MPAWLATREGKSALLCASRERRPRCGANTCINSHVCSVNLMHLLRVTQGGGSCIPRHPCTAAGSAPPQLTRSRLAPPEAACPEQEVAARRTLLIVLRNLGFRNELAAAAVWYAAHNGLTHFLYTRTTKSSLYVPCKPSMSPVMFETKAFGCPSIEHNCHRGVVRRGIRRGATGAVAVVGFILPLVALPRHL